MSGVPTRSDALARGFDAGNYGNAYTSTDFDTAWLVVDDGEQHDPYRTVDSSAFGAAFLIGFFATYEEHEIPGEQREFWRAAVETYGAEMRKLGIAVDELEES